MEKAPSTSAASERDQVIELFAYDPEGEYGIGAVADALKLPWKKAAELVRSLKQEGVLRSKRISGAGGFRLYYSFNLARLAFQRS